MAWTQNQQQEENSDYQAGRRYAREAARGATLKQIRANLKNIEPIAHENPDFYAGWRQGAKEELESQGQKPWWKIWQ